MNKAGIVGGADANKISISSTTGLLSFVTAPNFELPSDAGGNNVYDIVVQASDSHGGIDKQVIAVSVQNIEESTTPPLADNDVIDIKNTATDQPIQTSRGDVVKSDIVKGGEMNR